MIYILFFYICFMLPYYKQSKDWTCGPACMRMVLASFGIRKSEAAVAKLLCVSKVSGTKHKKFAELSEKLKLSYVVRRKGSVEEIKEFLPWCKIIVCYWLPDEKSGHNAVVRKISSKRIYLFDPWFGRNYSLPLSYFNKNWRCRQDKRWFIAIKL